jgi:hypothetical protein
MSRRLLTAEEEERRRVAVELHDDLGEVLTAARISLESAEGSSDVSAAHAHLREAIGCVDQAMQRVRDLALDLRPSVLDDLGLAAALRWYVDRFAQKAHWETHLSIAPVAKLESGGRNDVLSSGAGGPDQRRAACARGEMYLSPGVSKRVVDDYVGRTGATGPLDALTPRQRGGPSSSRQGCTILLRIA